MSRPAAAMERYRRTLRDVDYPRWAEGFESALMVCIGGRSAIGERLTEAEMAVVAEVLRIFRCPGARPTPGSTHDE